MGLRLPESVRDWYGRDGATEILANHSNGDAVILVSQFAMKQSLSRQLLPFQVENQGVCEWSIMLDGSDDPPVYVDVDSNGAEWHLQAPTFSDHVRACVWDYKMVLGQPALVEAQNAPLSPESIEFLEHSFHAEPRTFGWPGDTQYRFSGHCQAVLIWSAEGQADWFVGATDGASLEEIGRAHV